MTLTAEKVAWLGLVIDAVLAVAKIAGGILFASQAILADGVHSLSDLCTDIAVVGGMRVSNKPADLSHPYGHRRVSTLVALFIGLVLILAAGFIAYTAISSLRVPKRHVQSLVPLLLAICTIPLKEFLYRITAHVGARTRDVSLTANAWHHRSDAFTSIAAAAGLAGIAFGGEQWAFLDPLTAMVLSAFLVVMALKIIRKASGELIDSAPPAEVIHAISEVLQNTEGVLGFHALRARQSGGQIETDVHIEVVPELTVAQGHQIAGAVKRRVMKAQPYVVQVVVHVEPAANEADSPGD